MNVAMESTQEIVDGQVKASFGDAFIRGNNGEWSTVQQIHAKSGKSNLTEVNEIRNRAL